MAYFEVQALLTTWTDELEYLGYILCELIDTNSLDTTGYRYHQAADLPALIGIIRLQLKEPDGSLVKIMSEDELKIFRRLMRKAKVIRNCMAHHNTQNENKLDDLENTKRTLSDMLEFAIRSIASDRGIYQVPWCPYRHICKAYMEAKKLAAVMVPLNQDPLLSIRERILREHDSQQKLQLYKRPKRKATEESRKKQKDDYETALIRKQQRKEQDIAMRTSHLVEKCHRLEQRFKKSQELGHARIKDTEMQMREEQKTYHRQRTEILKDGLLHASPDQKPLSIGIFVTISSPLWIAGLIIYNPFARGNDHSGDA